MTDVTIEDGESTPLHGGQSDTAPSTNNKHASSAIVRVFMMGTAVGVLLMLMLTGPSKMMRTNSSGNVVPAIEGEMVANSGSCLVDITDCAPVTGTFMECRTP